MSLKTVSKRIFRYDLFDAAQPRFPKQHMSFPYIHRLAEVSAVPKHFEQYTIISHLDSVHEVSHPEPTGEQYGKITKHNSSNESPRSLSDVLGNDDPREHWKSKDRNSSGQSPKSLSDASCNDDPPKSPENKKIPLTKFKNALAGLAGATVIGSALCLRTLNLRRQSETKIDGINNETQQHIPGILVAMFAQYMERHVGKTMKIAELQAFQRTLHSTIRYAAKHIKSKRIASILEFLRFSLCFLMKVSSYFEVVNDIA